MIPSVFNINITNITSSSSTSAKALWTSAKSILDIDVGESAVGTSRQQKHRGNQPSAKAPWEPAVGESAVGTSRRRKRRGNQPSAKAPETGESTIDMI